MFDRAFEERLRQVEGLLCGLVGGLDVDAVPLAEAPSLFERFEGLARLASAGRTLMARRVEESRAWQASGHRDPAEWLAARTGSSLGAAKEELKTSQAIKDLPATRAAMTTGQVSAAQGATIADAAKVNPRAERDLLGQAQRSNLKDLRAAAGRAKAAADPDPAATHARIHRERRLSRWTDSEGAYNLKLRTTADQGARIDAVLDPIVDERYRASREDDHEARDTMACDAFVEACDRAAGGKESKRNPNPRFLALLRADVTALRRGRVDDGELCEITGIGPVPVATAIDLLGEAVVKLVITKGVDVANVTSLGRGPTAAMKVAMAWTHPVCTREGCGRTYVQYDHSLDVEFVKTQHTRLVETEPLCPFDHELKTNHGWSLVHGRGIRPMVPPGHALHPHSCGPPGDPPAAVAQRRATALRVADALRARLEPTPATLFA